MSQKQQKMSFTTELPKKQQKCSTFDYELLINEVRDLKTKVRSLSRQVG